MLLLPQPTNQEAAAERPAGLPGDRITRIPARRAPVADVARRSFARGNNPAGVARQYAAIVVSPDRSPGLRKLKVPTLVLHGAEDPLIQVDGGRATAGAVPGARFVVFPGMGHDLPQQLWPQLVREIVTHAMSVQPGGATRA